MINNLVSIFVFPFSIAKRKKKKANLQLTLSGQALYTVINRKLKLSAVVFKKKRTCEVAHLKIYFIKVCFKNCLSC